jgi:hypothetical protein
VRLVPAVLAPRAVRALPCAKGRGPGHAWQKNMRHRSRGTPPRSFNLVASSDSRCTRKSRKRTTSRQPAVSPRNVLRTVATGRSVPPQRLARSQPIRRFPDDRGRKIWRVNSKTKNRFRNCFSGGLVNGAVFLIVGGQRRSTPGIHRGRDSIVVTLGKKFGDKAISLPKLKIEAV